MQTARIFRHGGSQAVRLPAEFRFDTSEVYVWRDDLSGNVVLSTHPLSWAHFLKLREQVLAEAAAEIESFKPGQRETLPIDNDDPFTGWAE